MERTGLGLKSGGLGGIGFFAHASAAFGNDIAPEETEFHRGHARYPNRRVHADLIVDGETGHLRNKMDHYYIRNFDHMIKKMTRYAEWGAAQMYIDGKTTSATGILGHTLGKFIRDYILNLGFLDGVQGLISVGMHVYYTFWKYSKLWELHQLKRQGKPLPLPKLDEDEGRWELPWVKSPGSRVPGPDTQ